MNRRVARCGARIITDPEQQSSDTQSAGSLVKGCGTIGIDDHGGSCKSGKGKYATGAIVCQDVQLLPTEGDAGFDQMAPMIQRPVVPIFEDIVDIMKGVTKTVLTQATDKGITAAVNLRHSPVLGNP